MISLTSRQRIEYVIVAAPGGDKYKVKELVVPPVELMEKWGRMRIHEVYYIRWEPASREATSREGVNLDYLRAALAPLYKKTLSPTRSCF